MSDASEEQMFYIRSLKHERGYGSRETTVIWWNPEQRGYTNDINRAGKYTLAEAESICGSRNAEWLGEGTAKRLEPNNVMVPVNDAHSLAQLVVDRSTLESLMLALAAAKLVQ